MKKQNKLISLIYICKSTETNDR